MRRIGTMQTFGQQTSYFKFTQKILSSLINHYTDAKDIWDNVKMLLEGSELTKEDRESQLYDDFEHFRQNKGETIHDYYVRFAKLINDMRNIKMTMSKIQLNSKFVNNMLPEWGRFVTAVKLNKGLKDSNFDQLYAYLKQHEAHANENKMMLERLTQQTVDPLALMSNVSPQHYHSQSSTIPPTTYHQPYSADTSQSDLGLSPTATLIENHNKHTGLTHPSYDTFLLKQTINSKLHQTQGISYIIRRKGVCSECQKLGRLSALNLQQGSTHSKELHSTQASTELRILQRQIVLLHAQENGVVLDDEQFSDDCDAYDLSLMRLPGTNYVFDKSIIADPWCDEDGPLIIRTSF
ncbi:hypothetical protein Tco_0005428 [Tanacetum coccineum]